VEYHAKGGGGESWHANRRTSGQLSFEGSWILLLNNNKCKHPVNSTVVTDEGTGKMRVAKLRVGILRVEVRAKHASI